MKDLKFSIILPIYNSENYLKDCIESIINQDYKNFILIAIDDASTDNSYNIIRYYQKIDNRIYTIHKTKNQGVSSARNLGIKTIKENFQDTDLLCFVDSDDIITRDFLSTFSKSFKANDIDCCICNYIEFKDKPPRIEKQSIHTEIISRKEHFNSIYNIRNKYNKTLTSSRYITNRCFKFSKVSNITFNNNLSCGEDTLWLTRALDSIDNSLITNKITYLYRKRENSLSNNDQIYSELLKLFKYQEKIVIEHNMIDYWWENVKYAHKSKVLKNHYSYFKLIKNRLDYHETSIRQKKRVFLFNLGYHFLTIIFKLFNRI